MRYTDEQENIFDIGINQLEQHMRILAVAGAGKTSTMLELIRRMNKFDPDRSVGMLAFNSNIVGEITDKIEDMGATAHVLSTYQLGLRHFVWPHYGRKKVQVKKWKYSDIVKLLMNEANTQLPYNEFLETKRNLVSLIDLARLYRLEFKSVTDLAVFGFQKGLATSFVEIAFNALTQSRFSVDEYSNGSKNAGKKIIDITDMVYLPSYKSLEPDIAFDDIIVDEAQDLNMAQWLMLKILVKAGSRLILVGDPKQSIYGFMGAYPRVMQSIAQELRMVDLPLSNTFRCPPNVSKLVHSVNPVIKSHKTVDGQIKAIHVSKVVEMVEPDDIVISRRRRPLITLCFQLIKARKPAAICGDNGSRFTSLFKRIKEMNGFTLEKLDQFIGKEHALEIARYTDTDGIIHPAAQNRIDAFYSAVRAIVEMVETPDSIDHIIHETQKLFADDSLIRLQTIHSTKGLEAPRIFIVDLGGLMPEWAVNEYNNQEENLWYVAATRSSSELYLCYENRLEYESMAERLSLNKSLVNQEN